MGSGKLRPGIDWKRTGGCGHECEALGKTEIWGQDSKGPVLGMGGRWGRLQALWGQFPTTLAISIFQEVKVESKIPSYS
jgi:hypothetical protein